jgi:hypothetical protein
MPSIGLGICASTASGESMLPSTMCTPLAASFCAAGERALRVSAYSSYSSGCASSALRHAPPCKPVAPVTRMRETMVGERREMGIAGVG